MEKLTGTTVFLAVVFLPQLSYSCYKFPLGVKNPCEDKKCDYGAHCRPSLDGRTAKCVCPEKCASYGDNRGSRPVCGTDGKNYDNDCELRRAACRKMKKIEVKFQGRCDPCEGVECPSFQVCQLDEKRNPICRCNSICTSEIRSVCASDGKTYTNECILRVESCKSRRNLRVIFNGECSKGINPCESIRCSPRQFCHIDHYGIATCQCPPTCEPAMRPVCGTDGLTYDSECELTREACLQQKNVSAAYNGTCGEVGLCTNHTCDFGSICVQDGNEPKCECPHCFEEIRPVCGSDDISYPNECKLKREACNQRKSIQITYRRLCSGCENKLCKYYSFCESTGHEESRCVCPQSCLSVESHVCGTDGITYPNECEMRVAACRKQEHIMVSSRGECDVKSAIRICQRSCHYGGVCETTDNSLPRCVCNFTCSNTEESICGSDGKVYENECRLREESCIIQKPLTLASFDKCEELCSCNKLGSLEQICEPISKQCPCKPGVGGKRCDRCEPGFWGLHKISEGTIGCAPCGCNSYGSIRDDCEQMTGRCVCKHNVQGIKCDICPQNTILGQDGCTNVTVANLISESCDQMKCSYGATCQEKEGRLQCICNFNCTSNITSNAICASDGNTYSSECEMRLYSCRSQQNVSVANYVPCNKDDTAKEKLKDLDVGKTRN